MVKSILASFSPSPALFLKELFQKDINEAILFKILKSEKFSIEHQNERGETFLHLCISHDKFKSARWLIENSGINPDISDYFGLKPIDIAIKKNNFLIVELLMKHVDVCKADKDGRSLLQNAVLNGNYEVSKQLIDNCSNINHIDKNGKNVMFDAIAYGDERIIDKLLNDTDINLNQQDSQQQTILHKKEVFTNNKLCSKFIQKGADPTICDINGENFLYHSAMRGIEGEEILNIALQKGFNISATVKNNNTILIETLLAFYKIPLHEIERRESLLKMAEQLINKGIDINIINNDGENGLFEAVRNNDFKVCAILINSKIQINVQNNKSETPLLIAALYGISHLDILLLLLKNGANPAIKNYKNEDVLEILNNLILHFHSRKRLDKPYLPSCSLDEHHYLTILKEILKNSKYPLQNLTSKGQPLFFAPFLYGDIDLFKLYMIHKFDINALNTNERNVFYLYVLHVFQSNKYFDDFKQNLHTLMSYMIDIDHKDEQGKNVISKIIKKDTNPLLFEILIDIVRFKLDSRDNQGRTICHHAILCKNLNIIKLIHQKDDKIINISDNFGILPITYCSLLGHHDVTVELLNYKNIYINSQKIIPYEVRLKFAPMVNNLNSLKEIALDKDLLRKIHILIDQIEKDFSLNKSN